MGGEPLSIGPWVGGINSYSDTTAVADNEAVELLNLEVDLDGSLISRPPFVVETITPGNNPMRLLGWYTDAAGVHYMVGASSTGTYYRTTGAWVLITNTFNAQTMVQYANKAWLIAPPTSVNPGGSWEPIGGFTAVAGVKKGASAVVYKERLWIGEGGASTTSSRLYFSDPATFGTFQAASFVDVKSGDGQDIIEISVFADSIVIWKQDSTYLFSYDSKPASGQVRIISNVIGLTTRDCSFEYENSLYVTHNESVYQITNWNFEKLNVKIPLIDTDLTPSSWGGTSRVFMWNMGDRLVLQYYDNVYVYGLKTRAWTHWTCSGSNFGKGFKDLDRIPAKYYVPGAMISGGFAAYTWSIQEDFAENRTETFSWKLVTKMYDFTTPANFKRLFHWGVDCIPKSPVSAKLHPASYGRKVTWSELRSRTWIQMRSYQWGRLDNSSYDVTDSQTVNGVFSRVFIKFLKSVRFRQLGFELSGVSTGAASTSPTRIFTITAWAKPTQQTTKSVN